MTTAFALGLATILVGRREDSNLKNDFSKMFSPRFHVYLPTDLLSM